MVKCIKGKETYFSVQLTVGKFYDYKIIEKEYSLITNYEKYIEYTTLIAGSRDNSASAKKMYEERKKYLKRVNLPTLVINSDDNHQHFFCNVKHSDLIDEHNVIIKEDPINIHNAHQSRIFNVSVYMTETYFETMDIVRNRILEKLGI